MRHRASERTDGVRQAPKEDPRAFLYPLLVLLAVSFGVATLALATLYRTAVEEEEARLADTARSQARLIEAFTRHEVEQHLSDLDAAFASALGQIEAANREFGGLGNTGEIVLGKRDGEEMVFLPTLRHGEAIGRRSVPFSSVLAEPMRRALSGESGKMVGLDYRGERVLAAYEPVANLDLGIVAKIDLSEIRAPFVRAALLAGSGGLALVFVGAMVLRRMSNALTRRLEESEETYRTLFESSADGIGVIADGVVIDCNERLCGLLSRRREDIVGHPFRDFLATHQPGNRDSELAIQEEFWVLLSGGEPLSHWKLQRSDGIIIDTETALKAVNLRGSQLVLAVVRDVTDRKKAEEKMHALAFYDALTGLPNRRLFQERLERTLEWAKPRGRSVGLAFLDVDDFKQINDTLGHSAGDRLLCEVARRLVSVVRLTDYVARSRPTSSDRAISRLGGDEFTLLLSEISDPQDVAAVAQRSLQALSKPFVVDDRSLYVTASIGIATFPGDAQDAETLLRNADTAMYQAKAEERNSWRFYDSSMNASASRRLHLANELRQALERGELSLHYQPIRSASTGEITSTEALLRWRTSEGESISAGEFIPIAEETGSILPIGEWVLRAACRQSQAWRTEGFRSPRVWVNVSARQFRQAGLAAMVKRTLREFDLGPDDLGLEITETTILQQGDPARASAQELHEMGLSLALDDFGTGYSSLSSLRGFPIDRLKVDRSFVEHIESDPSDAALVVAVIRMAHSLGIQVVAEGVETEPQAEFLRKHGCDQLQGFLFSPAVPAAEFSRFLEREKDDPEVDREKSSDSGATGG